MRFGPRSYLIFNSQCPYLQNKTSNSKIYWQSTWEPPTPLFLLIIVDLSPGFWWPCFSQRLGCSKASGRKFPNWTFTGVPSAWSCVSQEGNPAGDILFPLLFFLLQCCGAHWGLGRTGKCSVVEMYPQPFFFFVEMGFVPIASNRFDFAMYPC